MSVSVPSTAGSHLSFLENLILSTVWLHMFISKRKVFFGSVFQAFFFFKLSEIGFLCEVLVVLELAL